MVEVKIEDSGDLRCRSTLSYTPESTTLCRKPPSTDGEGLKRRFLSPAECKNEMRVCNGQHGVKCDAGAGACGLCGAREHVKVKLKAHGVSHYAISGYSTVVGTLDLYRDILRMKHTLISAF